MARKADKTTSSRIDQLIDYHLRLVQLLSYCPPAEANQIKSELALVDSFIGEIRGSKRMILVVDDEPVVAETLVEVLRLSGYEAFSTAHVLEAFALSADLRPDLALIDVMLGEANGVELALELHKSVPTMKLLLISGNVAASDYIAACQPSSAMLDLVEKPVPPEELLTTIAGLLSRPDSQPRQAAS
jgi:CheY-like chemotaxis protein